MSFVRKYVNLLIYILLSVCFFIFLSRDASLSKKLTIGTDFSKPTPYFTTLRPATYLRGNELVHPDAYVKVNLPRNFEKGVVTLEYEDAVGYNVWMGTGLESAVMTKPPEKAGEGRYRAVFEDSNIPVERSYFIHVIGLDREKPIKLEKMTIQLSNDTFKFGDYLNLWKIRIGQLL